MPRGCPPLQPGGSALLGRSVVLCFGDSLTEGFCKNGTEFCPYADRLEQRLKAEAESTASRPPRVIEAGCSGETTSEMVERLPELLESLASTLAVVDAVVILGGTNDLPSEEPELIFQNLARLHEVAHHSGAITGVLTLPELRQPGARAAEGQWAEKRLEVNRLLRDFARERGDRAFFVDVAEAFPQDTAHQELWERDGVHFTAKGYEALGDLLADAQFRPAKRAWKKCLKTEPLYPSCGADMCGAAEQPGTPIEQCRAIK